MDDRANADIELPCPECGRPSVVEWQVMAAGGPSSPPVPFLTGPKCLLRCCLACGLIRWFASPGALTDLRDRYAFAPAVDRH